MIPENPPKGESQSNGRIEEAVKTLRGFVTVMKNQWLVRLGAMVPSRFLAGKDGKTAFERRRGRRCNIQTEAFGEQIWFKELKAQTEKPHKFVSDWQSGLWLGHSRNSNETIVGTKEAVVQAWAIRGMAEGEQWGPILIRSFDKHPAAA